MKTERMAAFTDGVVAIIITIMVLELKVPESADLKGLLGAAPILAAYVLSFINVGLFWNNHHHMLQATEHIDGRALWANLMLLFWLSLVPFVIRWMDEAGFAALPVAAYGFVLGMSAVGYLWLQHAIVRVNGGPDSHLARALGHDWKGKLSLSGYFLSVPLAFVAPAIAIAVYVIVAVVWLIPDRRIERRLNATAADR
jgi:uncharacterized membrane protein